MKAEQTSRDIYIGLGVDRPLRDVRLSALPTSSERDAIEFDSDKNFGQTLEDLAAFNRPEPTMIFFEETPEGIPKSQGVRKAHRPKGSKTKPRKRQKMSIPAAGANRDWFATEHQICDIIEVGRKKWAVQIATGEQLCL